MSAPRIRPELSDDEVAAEIAFRTGYLLACLAMGRQRGFTVDRLAELTRLTPGTVTMLLTDWSIDASLAARS